MLAVAAARAGITVNLTWIGGTTGTFENSANWSVVRIPNSLSGFDDNLYIDNGAAANVTVTINSAANLRDLFVSSGDTLTITSGNSATFFPTNTGNGNQLGTIQNNGTINLAASGGSNTDLSLKSGTFTFSGSGTLTLSNNANNRILGNSATDELINSSTHTIQGAGQVGVGILKITNQGLILANQSNSLVVDPSSAGLTNTGTLRATSGATLALQNGTFTNTGGTIKADDNSFVDLTAATITGGTLTSINAGHFHSLGTANLLSGLTVSSGTNIEVPDNAALTIAGAIVNAGTIKLLSAGNTTDLKIDPAGATLSGGGAVTLSNTTANRLVAASGTPTLTNTDNAIGGAGQLGADTMGFVNGPSGLVVANQSNSLIIDPSALGVVNSGTLRATSGATLQLQNGTFTNYTNSGSLVNGLIEAQNGSRVDVSNATIDGGLLGTSGSGLVRMTGGDTLINPTITTSSTVQLNDNTATTLSGTLTNNGTLTFNSAGNTTSLLIASGGATLTGGGVVSLSNTTANVIGVASGTPTLVNVNNTIRGAGQLGVNALQFTNQSAGVVEANQSNPLTIDPGSGGVSNAGTLRATSGATLLLSDGTFTNTGTIEAQNASRVDLANATISGGLLNTVDSGLIRATGGAVLDTVTLTTGSTLRLNDNTSTTLNGTFTNHGTLDSESAGNTTTLLIPSGGATLTGSGLVTLSNTTANLIKGATTTTTLVNLNNTIRGAGQLGGDSLQFDNRPSGVVEANQSNPLIIDPSGTGAVNSGTLRATSGATLQLQNGTFNNYTNSGSLVNGTIEAQTGSRVDLSGATINGGLLKTSGTGLIRALGGVTLKDINLTSSSALQLNDNTATTFAGTLNNEGAIAMASGGNTTSFVVDPAGLTLSGSGFITLSNTTANVVTAAAADTLLVNLNNVIGGAGQLGNDKLQIDNRANGLIQATQSNPLIIDPSAAGLSNAGTLQAISGATLTLQNGTFTNTGAGKIYAGNNSVVQASNATIVGGELQSGTGAAFRTSGTATLSGVTLDANSVWNTPDNTTTTLVGTITNHGTFGLASGGNTTTLAIDAAGVTLVGGGAFSLSNTTANVIQGATVKTTLVNLDNTISGSGQITVGQLDNRASGIIEATQSNPLIIAPGGTATNIGVLRANGGTLRLSGGIFNNASGQIAATTGGSTVEFLNTRVNGGTLSNVAGAALNSIGGATFADIALTGSSTLNVPDNTVTTLAGAISNAGLVSVNSGGNTTDLVVDSAGVTLTGGGVVALSNSTANRFYGTGTLNNYDNTIRGSGQLGNNQLTLVNTGTIEANQSQPLTVNLNDATPFTNQGTLNVKSGASLVFTDGLTNAGLVSVAANGSFTAQSSFTQNGGFTSVQGTFSAASTTVQFGSFLEGNGTINGAVTSGGLISPGVLLSSGNSIGTLTFNNTLTLTDTSILLFELGGTNSYDKLVAPTISLDGYLAVTFANGFQNTVTNADSFTLLTTNTSGLSGTFASLPNGSFLPTIDGFGSFKVTYTGSSLTLSNFTPVPEPSTYALLGTGLVALLALRRRRR